MYLRAWATYSVSGFLMVEHHSILVNTQNDYTCIYTYIYIYIYISRHAVVCQRPVKKKIVPPKNFILGQKFSAIMLKIFVLP